MDTGISVQSNASKDIKVLLVDDDEDDYFETRQLFSQMSLLPAAQTNQQTYQLHWQSHFETGLAALRSGEYEVALVDYHLGERNGLELVREAQAAGCPAPLILLTGQGGPEVDRAASEAGAADFLVKGQISASLLERSIRYSLRQAALTDRLHRSEERYALAVAGAQDGLWDWDLVTNRVYYSPRWKAMLGWDASELSDHPNEWFNRIHLQDFAAVHSAIQTHVAGQSAFLQVEQRMLHRDGTLRWMLSRGLVVYNADGQAIRMAGSLTDITERKLAEQNLALEKERLAVTLRSIGDGVITTDDAGRVVYLNPVAETLTGWSLAEAIGQPFVTVFKLLNEKTGKMLISPVARILQADQPLNLEKETILVARHGQRYNVADSGAPIRDEENRLIGAVVVFRDVTYERRLNQELVKASRLESLGLLAGGIAHDFNNILTVILGNVSLARLQARPQSGLFAHLETTELAVNQAQKLTGQLLAFAKGGVPSREITNLAEIIRETAAFVRHGLSCLISTDLATDLWLVELDNGQFSQVLQNLLINAMQAMPNGGQVMVKAENIELGDETATGLPLAAGRYVLLLVKDHGEGITPENMTRIFEPYFTTKATGHGLGLATCFSIMRQHDGYITVESTVGLGTTFYLYLPASTKSATANPRQKLSNPLKGQGRILVMDDEASIRDLTKTALTRLGYEVETTTDGAAALSCYRAAKEEGHPFAVVLMDLTIPGGLGGEDVIGELLSYDPQAQVIVSSGYSTTTNLMTKYGQYGFRAALAKPYRLAELSDVLQKLLTERDS
jgi:PAS domain S-box-containing protein